MGILSSFDLPTVHSVIPWLICRCSNHNRFGIQGCRFLYFGIHRLFIIILLSFSDETIE